MAPWTKEIGPLSKAQKEGDVLKKRVDQIVKESNKIVSQKASGNKAAEKEKKLELMYQNCIDAKTLVKNLLADAEKLKEENEPDGKLKDFEKKKQTELSRLSVMQTLLGETMTKLLPNTDEKEFIKSHKSAEEKEKDEKEEANHKDKNENEEDDDEEEDEEDDDEEEDEEEDEEDEVTDEEEEESPAPKVVQKPKPQESKKTVAQKDESEDDEDDEDEDDDDVEEDEPVTKSAIKKDKGEAKEQDQDDDEEDENEEDDEEDDEEEDDDEEDDDEEDDDEEDETLLVKDKSKRKGGVSEPPKQVSYFITIDEFAGEEPGDLGFKAGEILTVIDTSREDGWWKAKNKQGETGLVPRTYLQVFDQKSAAQQEESEDDDEEEEERDEVDQASPGKRSGKKLWSGLKQALNETTVSDVLHAMGAVPPGFRASTLCRKFNEGDTYRLANYLVPKLSNSNLTYKDLFLNPATDKIRQRTVRIERVITIVSCQQIPPPGAGIEVLDRSVHVCLFDGQHILSNIHVVKVASVDKTQRTWSFTTKLSNMMDPSFHSEFFTRTNNHVDNIGILFELCISYIRISTNEKGQFSCGWVHLPLLDETGLVIPNNSFDLHVNGGTPYEKDVEVDPSISRRATSNALVSLISGNKQPRLVIRVRVPKQQYKDLMDTLPDTMLGNTSLLQLYSYYRHCLADVLLRDRLDLDSTELIHDPLLKAFPITADVPDLMKIFRIAWMDKLQDVKRVEKARFSFGVNPLRDHEFMKNLFRQVFLETVYPMSHLATLPAYKMGDTDNKQNRWELLSRFQERKRNANSALAALLSPDLLYEPFVLDEVAFNIISPYCLSKLVTSEG